MAAKKNTTERIYCNQCRGKTVHRLVKRMNDSGTDDETGFWWSTTFDMLQCGGCREVLLRRRFDFSENAEPEIRIFPPPMSRYLPDWRYDIPAKMRVLLEEIYRSLDATNVRLPMMGARTLVDTLVVEKVGDVGTFEDKLREMEKQGFISRANREVLSAAFDAGSATSHRSHAFSPEEVDSVMDIVENMLQAVYVLPDVAKKLKKATPARPPRPQKSSRVTGSVPSQVASLRNRRKKKKKKKRKK